MKTNKSSVNREEEVTSQMFNAIAPSYDKLNRILSLGIDKRWRRELLKKMEEREGARVLDIACGTGDVTIALMKRGFNVVGVDIAEKMLEIANKKSDSTYHTLKSQKEEEKFYPATYIKASAELLPFEDNSFDAITIAFGIRNFQNMDKSLNEIWRVLKDGGTLSILEFAIPKNRVWGSLYSLYFNQILPKIGGLLTGESYAYTYLPQSLNGFPQYQDFLDIVEMCNFKNLSFKSLTGGVALLYSAQKITS